MAGALPVPHIRRLRRLWAGAILLLGILGTAVGWTIWELRRDAINDAIADSGNIVSMLASQLSRSIHAIDATLLEINRSSKAQDIDTPLGMGATFDREAIHDSLKEHRVPLPQVFNLADADKDGQVVVFDHWLANAEYQCRGPRLFPGCTQPNRQSIEHIDSGPKQGRWNLDHCLCPAHGELERRFRWDRLCSRQSKYFEDIYGSIRSVQDLLFTLVNPNGIILARYPRVKTSSAGDCPPKQIDLEVHSEREREFSRSCENGRQSSACVHPRHAGISPFREYSVTEETALTNWRRRAATIGSGSAILLACSIYFLMAVTRQVRRPEQIPKALTEKSRELTRMTRHDTLTGLANRTLFMERASEALAANTQSRGGVLGSAA